MTLARLASVPWNALAGVVTELEVPLALVLQGQSAERVLDRFLRDHRHFTAEQRAVAAESLFGVGLWRRRLSLGLSAPAPRVLLGLLVRDLAGREDASSLVGAELPPPVVPASLADRWSLPDWLDTAIAAALPEAEREPFARALCEPGPICLRANRERVDRDGLRRRLLEEGVETRMGALAPDALVVTSPRPNLLGTTAWSEGLFEVQDEGSQVLGTLLDVQPGDEVLDLCAGAGGKALQLAALGATVHATDVDLSKLGRLRTRAEHARTARVLIHGTQPSPGLRVGRVLVDAPCSELGALRRGPDLRWRLDPGGFEVFPALQRGLLQRGIQHLAPGGRLVYATCTFRPHENEAVAAAFEAAEPGLRRVPPTRADADGFLRLWPHRHGTDGFFAAVWELA